ncbi:MAG: hypothetical protein R2834_12685 [Rhodothermales bacterium]
MAELRLDHFIGALRDMESAQYRILDSLRETRAAFRSNIIYPHLGSLVQLYGALRQIAGGMDDVHKGRPKRIREIDLQNQQLMYDIPSLEDEKFELVRELIDWALPHVQEAIEEGKTIFEFVEDQLHLGEVGIVPSYVEEGYLLVPNRQQDELYILQYTISLFTDVNERYRSLKTSHVKTIPHRSVFRSPHSIKLELMEENRSLPNPATFLCNVDLDLPFEQTLLPVAKRKLMRRLFTQGGMA